MTEITVCFDDEQMAALYEHATQLAHDLRDQFEAALNDARLLAEHWETEYLELLATISGTE